MKVSMSNGLEGLEVTVSVTCAEPGDLPFWPALQLQSQPGCDEDEVSDRLLGTLNRALPDALDGATGQIRTAIAEMHLSRLLESREDSPFSEAVKDFEGIAYASAAPRPAIIVVYGPVGCGKTTNAEKLQAYFQADTVIDELTDDPVIPRSGLTLILTSHTIPSAIQVLSKDGITGPRVSRLSFIPFDTALQELR